MIDFIGKWSNSTGLPAKRFIEWLELNPSKYFDWKERYGKVNEHNGKVPRDHWLEKEEQDAIVEFAKQHPLDGYRRIAFMMLDADIVAASPTSVYRIMAREGLLQKWNRKPSKKGTGFVQPLQPHDHWHIDVSYINVCGTFYYLCSVLDGCSRAIAHWEIHESMTEQQVEIVLQRARERFPESKARIISDNGPQFIAKDFKEFIRVSGMSHVRTSPFYPQSNGKIERWHKTLKVEAVRPFTPLSLEDARRTVGKFVEDYNLRRLHSAIGYITPMDRLNGRHEQIWADRDRKLEAARERRAQNRRRARNSSSGVRIDAPELGPA